MIDISRAAHYTVPSLRENADFVAVEWVDADAAELCASEWMRPHNKVTTCPVCRDWVVMKKDAAGNIVCVCEYCGGVWHDIEDALKRRAPDQWSTEPFTEITREEVCTHGWNRYDDVFYMEDKK